MSQRFRASMRLRHSRQFDEVFRCSKRSTDQWVSVLARGNGSELARLGLAISKKCARKAVERNRIKRTIRESFRHNIGRLRGLDLVIIGRKKPKNDELGLLSSSLDKHWQVVSKRCEIC